MHGSGDLLQTLMANDLVDEYRLFVYPVVVGSGRRLFNQGAPPGGRSSLTDATTTSAGVVIVTYERGGPLGTGSFDGRESLTLGARHFAVDAACRARRPRAMILS